MPLSPAVIPELRRLLGPEGLVVTPEGRMTYDCDMHTFYKGTPELVALPRTTAQVVELVRLCRRERVAVIPRGSGTGLIGGATAPEGGIMISTTRMNEILEIDLANRSATVQAGLINVRLSNAVHERGRTALLEVRRDREPRARTRGRDRCRRARAAGRQGRRPPRIRSHGRDRGQRGHARHRDRRHGPA